VSLSSSPPTLRAQVIIVLLSLATMGAAPVRLLRSEPLDVVTSHGVFHFTVEIADTDATRERGLMFRTKLAPDRGMLFDFKTAQPVGFWMRNTLIPLDMLFIGANGRIVSIARDATPKSDATIPSGGPILGVLEIRGGRAAEIDAAPGDLVENRIFHR